MSTSRAELTENLIIFWYFSFDTLIVVEAKTFIIAERSKIAKIKIAKTSIKNVREFLLKNLKYKNALDWWPILVLSR